MKPTTKIQKQIVAYSNALPPIKEEVVKKLNNKAFPHIGLYSGGKCTCTDCGNSFKYTASPLGLAIEKHRQKCPACNTNLTIEQTRRRKHRYTRYICVSTYIGNYQVLRYIESIRQVYKGEPAKYAYCETVRLFIDVNNPLTKHVVALRPVRNWCSDGFTWGSEMEYRCCRPDYNGYDKYDINPYAIHTEKTHPTLKQKGLKKSFFDLHPYLLILKLTLYPQCETLLKAKQYLLVRQMINNTSEIIECWPAIKICLRNNYKIKDVPIWIDYIRFLQRAGKDIHNAHYVCPKNLTAAHDYWNNKMTANTHAIEICKLKNSAPFLEKRRKPFSKFEIKEKGISIKVLQTVEQYFEEGEKLKHCVRTYVDKPNSLILSVKKQNKHYATIEYSLRTHAVVQCRGACNKQVDEHDTLIELVNSHSKTIKQLAVNL